MFRQTKRSAQFSKPKALFYAGGSQINFSRSNEFSKPKDLFNFRRSSAGLRHFVGSDSDGSFGRFGGSNGHSGEEKGVVNLFSEEILGAKCPASFKYVAVVLERDALGMVPTKLVYGKMYPPVGIDVSEGKCAVLVGKKMADKLSEGRSGFLEVDPLDIIELRGQQQFSDRDVGTVVDRAPSPKPLPLSLPPAAPLVPPTFAGRAKNTRRIQEEF